MNNCVRPILRGSQPDCRPQGSGGHGAGERGVPQRPAREAARLARGSRATEGEGITPQKGFIGRAGLQHEPAEAA
jgi:hypothetical protein